MSIFYSIGLQLIKAIKALHKLGYVHRDIKLENICIGWKKGQDLDNINLVLIDYGLARKFQLNQVVADEEIVDEKGGFSGNYMFAAKN
jgi:serine/threonine protein kinase